MKQGCRHALDYKLDLANTKVNEHETLWDYGIIYFSLQNVEHFFKKTVFWRSGARAPD